jgi:hypothetical protein
LMMLRRRRLSWRYVESWIEVFFSHSVLLTLTLLLAGFFRVILDRGDAQVFLLAL